MAIARSKGKQRDIPHRNKSPHGWWIASYIIRFEYEDEDGTDPNRRCLAWENTILLTARNREEAFRKAAKFGKAGDGDGTYRDIGGRKGTWRYEGLTDLLPIYEELEDGAEILWKEHRNRMVRTIQSRVKSKGELKVFDDSDDPE